jgi:hypothetical protein
LSFGGAEGIRTLDLLDAIEARFQLRHGPTERMNFYNTRFREGQTRRCLSCIGTSRRALRRSAGRLQ